MLAEALAKCWVRSRSGQGADRMFEESIPRSCGHTSQAADEYQVSLTLRGEIQDEAFLRFLGNRHFRAGDARVVLDNRFVVLDRLVHRSQEIPKALASRVPLLLKSASWRGAGTHAVRRVASASAGSTRADADKATAKALLQHLEKFETATDIEEFEQGLPQHTRDAIHRLLGELKKDGKVELLGQKRGSRWALKKVSFAAEQADPCGCGKTLRQNRKSV